MRDITITVSDTEEVMLGGFVNLGLHDPSFRANPTRVILLERTAARFDQIARAFPELAVVPPAPPQPVNALEVPAWGSVQGDAEGHSRRMRAARGEVYTIRAPANGRAVIASGAIVPAGSGSLGGKLSLTKGDLGGWDGTGGGAGGAMLDRMDAVAGDVWFTFRLGADQADSDINLTVQFA